MTYDKPRKYSFNEETQRCTFLPREIHFAIYAHLVICVLVDSSFFFFYFFFTQLGILEENKTQIFTVAKSASQNKH